MSEYPARSSRKESTWFDEALVRALPTPRLRRMFDSLSQRMKSKTYDYVEGDYDAKRLMEKELETRGALPKPPSGWDMLEEAYAELFRDGQG